jgi:hypothetical protein
MEVVKKQHGLDGTERARVGFIDDGLRHAELTLAALRAYKKFRDTGGDTDRLAAGDAIRALFAFRREKEHMGISNMGYLAGRESESWDASLGKLSRSARKLDELWKFRFDPRENGREKGWQRADYDDSSWENIRVDSCWEQQTPGRNWKNEHGKDYDGIAWYRTRFRLQAEDSGKKIELLFGAVDEACEIYMNGEKVHARAYDKRRSGKRPFTPGPPRSRTTSCLTAPWLHPDVSQ